MRKTSILLLFIFLFSYSNIRAQVGTDSTFEVVTWNIEWLGTTSSGPSNESLQLSNAALVMATINADFYALQEIRDQATLNDLINALNANEDSPDSYTGFVAPHVSCCQRMAFIYNTDVVTLKSLGAISQGQSEFSWAGRLPYFMEFDATVNGITKTILAITVHAKAFADQNSYNRRVDAARDLYDFLADQHSDDAIIFLGDYNDDVDVSTFNEMTTPYIDFVGDIQNYNIPSRDLSALRRSSTVSGPEMIDHITISNELFEDYVDESVAIHEPDYISNYGNNTSDHFPIFAQFSFQVATSTDEDPDLPSDVALMQNYPNPFNPSTNIEFALNTPQSVSLTIFSVTGRRVAELATGQRFSSGTHTLSFDAGNLSSGIYYYQLRTESTTLTRSMTLIK